MAETTPPGDPVEISVMTEIAIIAHMSDNLFARHLPKGITTAQFGVLNRLVRLGLRETVGNLARAFQVTAPTMSSTIRQLEKKELVTLESTEADRRQRFVVITKQGEIVRGQGVQIQLDLIDRMGKQVEPNDWTTIFPALQQIRQRLEEFS